MAKSKFRLYLYAVMTLAVMGLIYYFSSHDGGTSRELSDGLLSDVLGLLGLTREITERIGIGIRKLAHLAEYAALGISSALFFRELDISLKSTKPSGRFFWYSVLLSFFYAVSDEIHQHFVPGRSMQLSDVLLDSFGALAAAFVVRQADRYIKLRRGAEEL